MNNYYPPGQRWTYSGTGGAATQNRWLYNGKEHQAVAGLNFLDYGARQYDPILGRWHSIDLLTEKSSNKTPYGFASNNPANRVDTDGKWDVSVHLYANRSEYGYGIAVVTDRNGNEIYQFTVRAEGIGGSNRMIRGADTPLGTYDIPDDMPWLSGGSRMSYGPNSRLNMTGEMGEIMESGRDNIRIHGGRQETYNAETGEYDSVTNPQLKKTAGCLRSYDTDINSMKTITTNLQSSDENEVPGRVTITDDLRKVTKPASTNNSVEVKIDYIVPQEDDSWKYKF